MRAGRGDAVAGAVAEAVLAVPGVACLKPGLRGLLRSVLPSGATAARPADGAGSVRHPPRGGSDSPGAEAGGQLTEVPSGTVRAAVRLESDAAGRVVRVHVFLLARHGERAADVAGRARAAAAGAAAVPLSAVEVTVAGIV
ncbi:hypothetical protein [Streptomyces sp. NPDC097619]|uniref:hypothetical protein n=1 Tax=Streptomyces sp. NPDC097619 TaxID=3157228 RepID=UPI00332E6349